MTMNISPSLTHCSVDGSDITADASESTPNRTDTGWQLVSAIPLNILQGLDITVVWSYGLKQQTLFGRPTSRRWWSQSTMAFLPPRFPQFDDVTTNRRTRQSFHHCDFNHFLLSAPPVSDDACLEQRLAHTTHQRIISRHRQYHRLQHYTKFPVH